MSNDRLVVGNRLLSFEVAAGWAKLPPGISFGYTHGIVADARDHIYVLHTKEPNVVEFAPDGSYLSSWSISGISDGAHGFYLHKDPDGNEYLYITDCNLGTVVKTTLAGEELFRLAHPPLPDHYGPDKPYRPTDIAVDPNGHILVADGYGQSLIHVYTPDGSYVRSWGGTGSEPGRLNCPHGISVKGTDTDAELYVADRGNYRIQVFTLDGEHKRFIDNDLDMPCSFFFHNGYMYFPDLHSRVTVFDSDDLLVAHLGEDQSAYKQQGWPNLPKEYYCPHKFSSPHGLCVNSQGDVFVAEWISDGRVTKLLSLKR